MKLRRATNVVPLIMLLLAVPSFASVNISNLAGAQSEVGIAVNPTNPLNLVVVSNNIADLSRLGTWFSLNGGATWTPNFLDENTDGFGANDSRFDPNVAFDSDGNVYVIYSTTGTGNRLLLARSTDGGQNFNLVTTVTTDAGANNLHTAMVTTRSDAGGDDDVLVVWARVQVGGESIEAALSLDAGATFSTTNNNINDALQRTFLPWAAVDANGDFHVVWEVNQGGGAGVVLHDILDGVTLADGANNQVTTVQITDFDAATSKIPAQPNRGIFSVTTVDVNRSTGRVYVSYTDRPSTASNDTNIFVRFSDDNGAIWNARIQVNDDATTTSQFLPRMAIDQITGVVYAMWYDARNDAANNQQVDVFVSASLDGGLNWSPNQQLTGARSDESTTNPARDDNNYGEYFGLTAHNGIAHAAWTDARAANFTAGTNEDIYTDQVQLGLKELTSVDFRDICPNPPLIGLGTLLFAADPSNPNDTLFFTSGAIGRIQSAVYAGVGAAAGKFCYVYQVDCTGGNVTNPDFTIPLSGATLDTSLLGSTFAKIQTEDAPGCCPLPPPFTEPNLSPFNLSEFGALGGTTDDDILQVARVSDTVVVNMDDGGVFWSAPLLVFITDTPPTVGYATVTGPLSAGTNRIRAVVPGESATTEIVSMDTTPGGTIMTDTEGDGATPGDPVETAVTSPNAGTVSVTELSAITGTPPIGFSFFGQEVSITAPSATANSPLILIFQIDASRIPAGQNQNTIQVFNDGVLVVNCTGGPGVAQPDPCVANRALLTDGDVQLTVLTSMASQWNFGAPALEECTDGVDNNGDGLVDCDDPQCTEFFNCLPTMNNPPEAVCKDITIILAPGHDCAHIHQEDIDGGSFDPDGDTTELHMVAVDGQELPTPVHELEICEPGVHTITLLVTDEQGARDTCDATVTIIDDFDGDGIPNAVDACPASNLSATVIIDGCDSMVTNTLLPTGCTISDQIATCAVGASNHGGFISCVTHLTNDLKTAGTITGQQKGAVQSCAARARIP